MSIKGVIFDLDGTVVENSYDWLRIREELGTDATSILNYLDSLEGPERSQKWSVLETHEAKQTEASVLREGVRDLLGLLRERGIAVALVTNNSRKNTEFLLAKFGLAFDCVITRESGLWKPSGAPFLEVLKNLGLEPGDCCVVGDTSFDILAAIDAGIGAIFLLSGDPERFAGFPVEVFPDIAFLKKCLESILVGP
ncbi:MAG: HAD family hydrolase [Candidatus Aminicenantes bacterium]|nr:MAG: HAD family hydrolase [Candidatus Aminicenantes bacterium]